MPLSLCLSMYAHYMKKPKYKYTLKGGGGGVQAYNFGNFNYVIRVEGEGQDTSRLF